MTWSRRKAGLLDRLLEDSRPVVVVPLRRPEPTPEGVPRGQGCGPAARHTRFGRTAITVGASDPGERIAAAPGHKRIRSFEDEVVSSCLVRRYVSGLWPGWGADPRGISPISSHQVLLLSSPTTMTPSTDNSR
jgi:hypothetical protein